MATTTWVTDIQDRKRRLSKIRGLLGQTTPDTKVWADGRILVLQYDLITVSPQGARDPRTAAYQAVEAYAKSNGGVEMTESVYAIPLPAGQESEAFAVRFWNGLAAKMAGLLKEGDLFYLLYSAKKLNDMGVMGQVVDNTVTLARWQLQTSSRIP